MISSALLVSFWRFSRVRHSPTVGAMGATGSVRCATSATVTAVGSLCTTSGVVELFASRAARFLGLLKRVRRRLIPLPCVGNALGS